MACGVSSPQNSLIYQVRVDGDVRRGSGQQFVVSVRDVVVYPR